MFIISTFKFFILFLLTYQLHSSRVDYYRKITTFSNNTIASQDPNSKLGCHALDYILKNQNILQIPKQFSLCVYDLFPFKYELLSYLSGLPAIKESIYGEQRLSTFLLTYYILYYLHAPKDAINNYIKNKKLKSYYKVKEVDESVKLSYDIISPLDFDQDHINLLNTFGYFYNMHNELKNIFDSMNSLIRKSNHLDVLISFTSNFDKFKNAFFIAVSRVYNIKLEEYKVLDLDLATIPKNQEVNKLLSQSGGFCVISYLDLCNHFQPVYEDMRDKRNLIITTTNGKFNVAVDRDYFPGQEITYTFISDNSNILLLYKYGFVIHPNIFNLIKLKVEEEKPLNLFQFGLCKELGCVDSSIKDPLKVPKTKEMSLRISRVEESLLNLGRVKHIEENQTNTKNIIKTLLNRQIISYKNEISSWMFYYSKIKKHHVQGYPLKLIDDIQILRNKIKSNLEQNTQYLKAQNIYLLELSHKIILDKHIKASVNQIIYLANLEIDKIRNSYLN